MISGVGMHVLDRDDGTFSESTNGSDLEKNLRERTQRSSVAVQTRYPMGIFADGGDLGKVHDGLIRYLIEHDPEGSVASRGRAR